MLNRKTVNIISICFIGVLLLLKVSGRYPVQWWMYLLPLLFLPLYVRGAMNIRSGFFLEALCNADTHEKVVALSFDDGPQPEYTPLILDILEEHQVPAAFFCIGKNIEVHADLLQRIHADGHLIGNHSYSHHFWFDMYSSRRMEADLEKMDTLTIQATGLQPRLFRPPYGVTNPNVAKAVSKGQYLPVGWNIRSLDTVATDENKLMGRIMDALQPGAIILLHDTCRITADILPRLISSIREKGYRLERIDKMLNIPAYV